MTSFQPQYLTYISRRYSTYTNTRTLWEAAGGDIAEIEDQGAALDRWTHLLRLAHSGAIRPIDLTLAALQRDPHNPVLLADLQCRVPEPLQRQAEDVVSKVLNAPQNAPQLEFDHVFKQLDDLKQPEVLAATVLAAEKVEQTRSGAAGALLDVLKEGAKTAGTGLIRIGLSALAQHLGVQSDGS